MIVHMHEIIYHKCKICICRHFLIFIVPHGCYTWMFSSFCLPNTGWSLVISDISANVKIDWYKINAFHLSFFWCTSQITCPCLSNMILDWRLLLLWYFVSLLWNTRSVLSFFSSGFSSSQWYFHHFSWASLHSVSFTFLMSLTFIPSKNLLFSHYLLSSILDIMVFFLLISL